jgi:uncharacterized protein YjiS (DUF1127 family)
MIIMEAILSASALLHGRAAQSVARSVVRTFKRWRATYTAWHRERRAMAELLSMSDRDLRDIGIDRCEILRAVRGDTARERNTVYGAIPISFAISRPSERGRQYWVTSLALPTEVNGTLIGFRFPAATSSVNVAGWHFLFCDRRQARGGHVFTLTTGTREKIQKNSKREMSSAANCLHVASRLVASVAAPACAANHLINHGLSGPCCGVKICAFRMTTNALSNKRMKVRGPFIQSGAT